MIVWVVFRLVTKSASPSVDGLVNFVGVSGFAQSDDSPMQFNYSRLKLIDEQSTMIVDMNNQRSITARLHRDLGRRRETRRNPGVSSCKLYCSTYVSARGILYNVTLARLRRWPRYRQWHREEIKKRCVAISPFVTSDSRTVNHLVAGVHCVGCAWSVLEDEGPLVLTPQRNLPVRLSTGLPHGRIWSPI